MSYRFYSIYGVFRVCVTQCNAEVVKPRAVKSVRQSDLWLVVYYSKRMSLKCLKVWMRGSLSIERSPIISRRQSMVSEGRWC